jgi:hypothetical protein
MMTCSSPWEIVLGTWDGVNPSLPSCVHVRTEFTFIAYIITYWSLLKARSGVEQLVQEAKVML